MNHGYRCIDLEEEPSILVNDLSDTTLPDARLASLSLSTTQMDQRVARVLNGVNGDGEEEVATATGPETLEALVDNDLEEQAVDNFWSLNVSLQRAFYAKRPEV